VTNLIDENLSARAQSWGVLPAPPQTITVHNATNKIQV